MLTVDELQVPEVMEVVLVAVKPVKTPLNTSFPPVIDEVRAMVTLPDTKDESEM